MVEIVARYAALQRDYGKGSSPLTPESCMAMLSLFSTILEYFAIAMLEAKELFAMVTSHIPGPHEMVERSSFMDTMMKTIKQKDEACQVPRDIAKADDQNSCEESMNSTKAEEASDEDWEVVEKDDVDNMAGPLSDWETIPFTVLDLHSLSLPN